MFGKNIELNFCTFCGIPVRVQIGVVFLLAGAAWLAIDCGFDTVESILLVTGVLFSLFLHALGHMLTFLFYGNKPKRILLTPYGERVFPLFHEDSTTFQRLAIILSGPLVSFLTAAALFPGLTHFPLAYALELSSALEGLFLFNAYLVVVNLFPVPPLDGYSFVTSLTGQSEEVTRRLYNVNQILLTLVFLLGFLLEAPLLSLVSLLVYIQCIKVHFKKHAQMVASRYQARDIMTPLDALQFFRHGLSITDARFIILRSFQQYFPVLSGTRLKGIVNRAELRALHPDDVDDRSVNEVAEFPQTVLHDTDSISCLLDDSRSIHYPVAILNEDEDFVGLITYEQFMEWITFHMSQDSKSRPDSGEDADERRARSSAPSDDKKKEDRL